MRVPIFLALSLLWIIQGGPRASAQPSSDICHVYVVDVKASREFMENADLNELAQKSKQEQEQIAEAAGLGKTFGEFQTIVGEEQLTTKTYPFPKSKLIVTASVYYTDEMMASSNAAESMLLGITVAAKAYDDALSAPENAVAEVSYTENTDAVRVKKNVVVDGREYLIGLECRCKDKVSKDDK